LISATLTNTIGKASEKMKRGQVIRFTRFLESRVYNTPRNSDIKLKTPYSKVVIFKKNLKAWAYLRRSKCRAQALKPVSDPSIQLIGFE